MNVIFQAIVLTPLYRSPVWTGHQRPPAAHPAFLPSETSQQTIAQATAVALYESNITKSTSHMLRF